MKRTARIWRIVLSALVIVLLFLIWRFPVGGRRYLLLEAWIQVFQTNQYMDFWLQSSAGPMLALCHILATIAGILYSVRISLMIFRKEVHVLDLASRASVFLGLIAAILAANAYEGVAGTALNKEQEDLVPILFVSVASLFEYVGFRFFDEWYEQLETYREVKRKEKEARLRRKKALYFPGHYPKELMILVWENFRSSMKDGILLILGGSFTGIFLIVSCGVFLASGNLPQGPGIPEWLLKLQGIFTGSTMMILFLCIILMYNLISNYTKVRNREYRTFLILGIRSRTIYLIFAVEFTASMILAALIGFASGSIVYQLLRNVLKRIVILPPLLSVDVIGWGGLVFIVTLIFSVMLNQENILRMGNSTVLYQEKEAEKVPYAVWRRILFGFLMLDGAASVYTSVMWNENKGSYLIAAGSVFLILTGYMVRSVRKKEKNPDQYIRDILWRKEWRYRFKKNRWSIYLMTIVHVCVLSFAGGSLVSGVIAPKPEAQIPYDIVCMVYDQDMSRVQEILDSYDVETQTYPMVRVNSVQGSNQLQDARMVSMEQGEYIGISQDTYRALKEAVGGEPENLNLTDGQIYTVYQQNVSMSSRNLDYSGSRTGNYLRFGQPLIYYSVDRRHEIYTGHEEVGRERDILTGVLGEGEQEHLVVFSDEEFARGYEDVRKKNEENMPVLMEEGEAAWEQYLMENEDNLTDGPTNLILINVDEGQYERLVSDLAFLDKNYPIDRIFDERVANLYPKEDMIVSVQEVNIRDVIIQAVAASLIFVFGLFQIYSKIQGEVGQMEEQDLFLLRLGMKEKERKYLIYRQIHRPFWISAVAGVMIEIIFALLTFENRLYSTGEMVRYLTAASVFTVIYYLIWELWLTAMEQSIWKEAKRRR